MAKSKPFGGVEYSFKGCKESMEQIFGDQEISSTEMTSKLWAYVKSKELQVK